jgi:hypothetical protein
MFRAPGQSIAIGKEWIGKGVGEQVLAARAHVADLHGELPRQLALDVEVPLQNLRRQQVSVMAVSEAPGLGAVDNCENCEDQLARPRVGPETFVIAEATEFGEVA